MKIVVPSLNCRFLAMVEFKKEDRDNYIYVAAVIWYPGNSTHAEFCYEIKDLRLIEPYNIHYYQNRMFDLSKYRDIIDSELKKYTCSAFCNSEMKMFGNESVCRDKKCTLDMFTSPINVTTGHFGIAIHRPKHDPNCQINSHLGSNWWHYPFPEHDEVETLLCNASMIIPKKKNDNDYAKFIFSRKEPYPAEHHINTIIGQISSKNWDYKNPACKFKSFNHSCKCIGELQYVQGYYSYYHYKYYNKKYGQCT